MAGTQSGFGVAVTFHSGFCAKIESVDWDGLERADIDTTHSASTNGWMTFQPSDLKNPGELKVNLQFNPNTAVPVDQAAETVTVTWPIQPGGSTAATWACSGYMKQYTPKAPIKDKMTGDAVLKFSGQPTFTPGS